MSAQPTDATEWNQNPAPDSQRSRTAESEGPDPARGLFKVIPAQVAQDFGPNTPGRPPADLTLISRDSVVFYVDEYSLLQFSNNNFKGLLPVPDQAREKRTIFLPDLPLSELEILLQAIYRVPTSTSGTIGGGSMDDFQMLVRGVGQLPTFGIAPKSVILPHTYIFDRILSFSPRYPLEVYALGGQYDIDEVAVAASPHTLTVELTNIDDELAERIGALYLLRLIRLHDKRKKIITDLLGEEPDSAAVCGSGHQRELKQRWKVATAFLLLGVNADIPTELIQEAVMTGTSAITCDGCIKARDARLNAVLTEWSMSVRSV
ncbi:hypothetical protein Moror_3973 [Moniliophthora roreri MCA 2997]|uniref:BTB domain-containing protein n=2 Tax=Moniliophthora roreri TaxID=221103 RepID=V2XRR3_MONRO|nr:hypothetical protein Moror_3973 [Moniliophthora roreri MCA 2997]KAI3616074.1 hypothetical protein WG66_013947 [Moniliophthora roreri]